MKQTLKMVYLSFTHWNELYNGSHVVELPKYRYTQTRTKENGAIDRQARAKKFKFVANIEERWYNNDSLHPQDKQL